MIQATNKNVACKPVDGSRNLGQKTKQGGIMVPDQITGLVETEVVFGNATYPAGCKVYLPPNAGFQAWGQRVFTVENQKFILVPESEILLMKPPDKTVAENPWEEWLRKYPPPTTCPVIPIQPPYHSAPWWPPGTIICNNSNLPVNGTATGTALPFVPVTTTQPTSFGIVDGIG
jgi:hypothetical protein